MPFACGAEVGPRPAHQVAHGVSHLVRLSDNEGFRQLCRDNLHRFDSICSVDAGLLQQSAQCECALIRLQSVATAFLNRIYQARICRISGRSHSDFTDGFRESKLNHSCCQVPPRIPRAHGRPFRSHLTEPLRSSRPRDLHPHFPDVPPENISRTTCSNKPQTTASIEDYTQTSVRNAPGTNSPAAPFRLLTPCPHSPTKTPVFATGHPSRRPRHGSSHGNFGSNFQVLPPEFSGPAPHENE